MSYVFLIATNTVHLILAAHVDLLTEKYFFYGIRYLKVLFFFLVWQTFRELFMYWVEWGPYSISWISIPLCAIDILDFVDICNYLENSVELACDLFLIVDKFITLETAMEKLEQILKMKLFIFEYAV